MVAPMDGGTPEEMERGEDVQDENVNPGGVDREGSEVGAIGEVKGRKLQDIVLVAKRAAVEEGVDTSRVSTGSLRRGNTSIRMDDGEETQEEDFYPGGEDTDSEDGYDEDEEGGGEWSSPEVDMGIMELVARTWALMPGVPPYPEHGNDEVKRIRTAIESLLEVTTGTGTRQDAGEWGRDGKGDEWEFRPEDIQRDEDLVDHHGCIEAASRARWTELDESARGRLNESRV
jgi:hypothetical protein